jgi:hypothetical protein
MRSVPRCWQCSSVTAQATAAVSQVQYSLQMLILPHMVCGCTATTVDGLCMAAVMQGNMPPYSFWMTHSSLFWDKWLLYSFETNACALRMPRLLCGTTTWLASLWLAGEQSMSQQCDLVTIMLSIWRVHFWLITSILFLRTTYWEKEKKKRKKMLHTHTHATRARTHVHARARAHTHTHCYYISTVSEPHFTWKNILVWRWPMPHI